LIILAFESSCDETGVAVVRVSGDGPPRLIAETLHSQIQLHRPFGGVVPELASRDHIRRVVGLTRAALADAGTGLGSIDAVAYTAGPGLAGALLVGAGVAHGLGFALQRPVLGVHHLEGHLVSPFVGSDRGPLFPFVALLVSGGHTQLMRVDGVGRYVLLGESIDDAAGEAFDKSALLLGLGYPGGAALSRLAELGDPSAFDLPRPLLQSASLDFSFSGLKTAVATRLQRLASPPDERFRADLAASLEAAIVDVLVHKTVSAMQRTECPRLVIAGGVGANRRLRGRLVEAGRRGGFEVCLPDPRWCTDNAAMIGYAAGCRVAAGCAELRPAGDFGVRPRWSLGEAWSPAPDR
jgi:N6-L-threonylcarbamoyladenine synthase